MNAGAISWLIVQTFWVGGIWLLQFLVMPALIKLGLAPLLIDDLMDTLKPLLVGLAACCAVLQAVVLIAASGLPSLWRDIRGQLLLTVLLMAVGYFAVHWLELQAPRWQLFNYMVLAFCGLLLVLQPVPAKSGG
ncbi:DUF4149 domain-containing protein [Pseudomonas sp. M30-35]|uniref:DUF4149 domain-containing protein n=1 Tax=Pseudomonas sp. M30-35 TaxID=1981174 RepID=UPI000B3CB88A|nr:DUF4149 domain-containing protein [Pseudomonas sp. M30-35]ARU90623.1 DUF4149 domain-containing protein [Pseudomonas sp. M30-35]